jgi:hypothetical protein
MANTGVGIPAINSATLLHACAQPANSPRVSRGHVGCPRLSGQHVIASFRGRMYPAARECILQHVDASFRRRHANPMAQAFRPLVKRIGSIRRRHVCRSKQDSQDTASRDLDVDEVPAWQTKLAGITGALLPWVCPLTTVVALAHPPAFLWCVSFALRTSSFGRRILYQRMFVQVIQKYSRYKMLDIRVECIHTSM